MRWKAVGTEAERCASVRGLEVFSAHAENEMVASRIENDEALRFCQSMRKTNLVRLYYKTVVRRGEIVDCLMLGKLQLRTRMMLR